MRQLIVLAAAVLSFGCSDDNGPPPIPDITGSFVGTVHFEASAEDIQVTGDCNATLAIPTQADTVWNGTVTLTGGDPAVCEPESRSVSGTIQVGGGVSMTVPGGSPADACTSFSGAEEFTGNLAGNTLTLAISYTCDGQTEDIAFSGTRS